MARSINERYLSTPYVPNVVINGEGQCWAASCASIVGYFYGINNYSELIELRDGIIETTSSIYIGLNEYPPGTSENAADLLTTLISNRTYNYYNNGWPSFSTIQTTINDNKPFYLNLQHFGLNPSAHATVLRGYYYNSSLPTSVPIAKRISMMDCNVSSYVLLSYGADYMIGSNSYTLYGTVR